MKVWRVSDHTNLSGQGGMVSAARWHQKGTPVVYCADHPATALLEKLVHVDIEDMPQGYTLITIEVPESASHRINASDLPDGWMSDTQVTQAIGTNILSRVEHLLVWVPSALVPYAWNALLNPRHPEASGCLITDVISSLFDPRFIR
jgi:RES domain-containing protein